MQISRQHPMISMTEVQPVLHQLFQRSGVTPVRLGTVHVPQIAIVPWHLYLAWWGALWRAKECSLIEEMRSRTDAARMFTSYRRELEPFLMSEKQALRVVVVKARDREVGALLAWADWMRFAPVEASAFPSDVAPAEDQRTYGIVFAHKHLSQFATQFAEEEARGHREPITVTKQGAPVMVLAPWALYQQWQARLSQIETSEGARPSLASDARPLSFADATLVEEVLTERKTALQPAFFPGKEWALPTAQTIITHVEHILDRLILFMRRDHLEDLVAYLEHRGWQREPHPNERLLKLTWPSTTGDPLVVFLPAGLNWRADRSPEYWDAEDLIRQVMRCQATLEQTTPYRILTRLRAFRQEEGMQRRSSAQAPVGQASPLWPWPVGTAVQLSRDGLAISDEAHEGGARPFAEDAVFYILGVVSHFVDGPAYEDESSPHYHEPFGHPAYSAPPGETGVTFYTSLFTHDPHETGILMEHEIRLASEQPQLETDKQIEAFLIEVVGKGGAAVLAMYRRQRLTASPRQALEAALRYGIACGYLPWGAKTFGMPRRPYAAAFEEGDQAEAEEWISFFLFEKMGETYQRDPEHAAGFLVEWILEELRQRFEEEMPAAPRLVELRKCLLWLLLSLDEQTVDHYPGEEACREAGRAILYAFISVFCPDFLETPSN
jgi:PHD/YefM family antitoxin component YafN of YafNO toxin-antitoxin module